MTLGQRFCTKFLKEYWTFTIWPTNYFYKRRGSYNFKAHKFEKCVAIPSF